VAEYNVGDLVEAIKEEGAACVYYRGLVVDQNEGGPTRHLAIATPLPPYKPRIDWLERSGFTLAIIEKATRPFPTNVYSVVKYQGKLPLVLHEDGLWYHVGYPAWMSEGRYQLGMTSAELFAECGSDFEMVDGGIAEGSGATQ